MAFDWIEPKHHASNWPNCSKCLDKWIERENARTLREQEKAKEQEAESVKK